MRRSTLTVPCHQRSPASGPGLPRGRKITAGKERHSLIVILFGALRCSSQRSSLTQGHSRESARATLWNVLGWGYTTLTFTFRHSLSLASRWKHSSCPTCTWTLSSREPCRCIFILLTVFHLHFHRMTLSLLILVFLCKPGRLFATYKDPLDHLHWAGTLLLYDHTRRSGTLVFGWDASLRLDASSWVTRGLYTQKKCEPRRWQSTTTPSARYSQPLVVDVVTRKRHKAGAIFRKWKVFLQWRWKQ